MQHLLRDQVVQDVPEQQIARGFPDDGVEPQRHELVDGTPRHVHGEEIVADEAVREPVDPATAPRREPLARCVVKGRCRVPACFEEPREQPAVHDLLREPDAQEPLHLGVLGDVEARERPFGRPLDLRRVGQLEHFLGAQRLRRRERPVVRVDSERRTHHLEQFAW